MKRTRALSTITLPAVLVAVLAATGCSFGSDNGEEGENGAVNGETQACAPAGEASGALQIEGDFGAPLTLASETPIEVAELERSVLIEGEGEEIAEDELVLTQLSVFNGVTGDTLAPTAPTAVTNGADESAFPAWVTETIACSTIGDRVAAVAPASKVLGDGQAASYGMEDADALVMVFDVLRAPALERAEGEAQDPVDGLPTVELAENGAPTITIPEGEDAPKELEIVPLIEGDGAEVGETDSVYLHYTGVVWSSGKEFDSSWTNGTPIMLPANQFVPGFTKAITGQKVGSQILAVIPADEGYAEATAERLSAADATEDDVMVFVVDILDAIPAQETADAEEGAGENAE